MAIVGTRRPSPEAVAYTDELVAALASSGVTIWSGGAAGIDIAAHRAALRVKLPTVVVAPAGWNRPHPPEHASDYRAIVEAGGAYLAIVSPHEPARRHQFFARNALLMALVDVAVVVQAGFRSGARNAAKVARRLGRPLFVAPSCPWVHQGVGCNLELSLGARMLLSPRDIIQALVRGGSGGVVSDPLEMASDYSERAANAVDRAARASSRAERAQGQGGTTALALADLDAELIEVVEAVRAGAKYVDAISERTGLRPAVVQSDVLRLTLLGILSTDSGGTITIVSY